MSDDYYMVCVADDERRLTEKVNSAISAGFIPHGGVSLSRGSWGWALAQALVHKKEQKDANNTH